MSEDAPVHGRVGNGLDAGLRFKVFLQSIYDSEEVRLLHDAVRQGHPDIRLHHVFCIERVVTRVEKIPNQHHHHAHEEQDASEYDLNAQDCLGQGPNKETG